MYKGERLPFANLSRYLRFIFENTENISIKFGPGASGVARYLTPRASNHNVCLKQKL